MMTRIILCMSFIFLMDSCQDSKQESETDWSRYPTVEVTNPTQLVTTGRIIETEQHMHLINDKYFFFIECFSQTGELHLYQLSGDTLKWEGLVTQRGEGPLEMSDHSQVYAWKGNMIVLSTAYRTQVFVLPAGRIADRSRLDKWGKYTVPHQVGFIDDMVPIDTTRYLVTTVGDVPSLLATYQLGDTALSYVPFPYPKDDFTNASKAIVYNGNIYRHPVEEKYLYNCSSGRYAYTFTLKGGQMSDISYLFNDPPVYVLGKDGINVYMANETLFGGDCYVTGKYIYVRLRNFTMGDLVDDTIEARNAGYPCWFNNEIKVFDWDGHPVRSYKFDRYLSNFVVDSHDRYLYGITKDVSTDDASLVRYELEEK